MQLYINAYETNVITNLTQTVKMRLLLPEGNVGVCWVNVKDKWGGKLGKGSGYNRPAESSVNLHISLF
jgi:hypothetical protein